MSQSTATRIEEDKPAPASGAAAVTVAAAPSRTMSRGMLRGLVKTIRPHQWVKNLFVLAPMFFHKDVFVTGPNRVPALNLIVTGEAFAATFVFCLLAGAVYTINDLADVEADRVHPVKRFRPIASGAVPEGVARAMAAGLVVASLVLGWVLSPAFFAVALVYFVENLAYTFKLKHVAFLDVALIAFGFVLRVLAGGIATHVPVSGYMLGCTALLALFLGFGKRRHELASENAGKQRAALEAYTPRSLNVALGTTGAATLVTYIAYTLDPATREFFHSDYLWLTAPFTAFGILRFLFLVSGRAGRGLEGRVADAGDAARRAVRENLLVWVVVVVAIVYRLRPSPVRKGSAMQPAPQADLRAKPGRVDRSRAHAAALPRLPARRHVPPRPERRRRRDRAAAPPRRGEPRDVRAHHGVDRRRLRGRLRRRRARPGLPPGEVRADSRSKGSSTRSSCASARRTSSAGSSRPSATRRSRARARSSASSCRSARASTRSSRSA